MVFVESEFKRFDVFGRGGNPSMLSRVAWVSDVLGGNDSTLSKDTSDEIRTGTFVFSVISEDAGMKGSEISKLCKFGKDLVSLING